MVQRIAIAFRTHRCDGLCIGVAQVMRGTVRGMGGEIGIACSACLCRGDTVRVECVRDVFSKVYIERGTDLCHRNIVRIGAITNVRRLVQCRCTDTLQGIGITGLEGKAHAADRSARRHFDIGIYCQPHP